MPQDALFCKASLFMVTGPNEHLHVVMNDPVAYPLKPDGRTVLLVNFCSYVDPAVNDDTCLLNVGDHDFIHHCTYVDYADAVLKLVEPIERDVGLHIHRIGTNVSEQVYQRILDGFHVSPRVPIKVSRFLKFCGL